MKRFITALAALAAVSAPALAAEGEAHAPEPHDWSWEGPFGQFDDAELQRGFLVYQQVCASCHGLDQLSFRNLGQPGGPFELIPDPEHEGEYLSWANPNDNPVVMAIAGEYMIMDGPDDAGDMFERAGVPADRFPNPFANPQQAAASNGGAIPPDLSVIVKARAGGAEYLRSLLLGYSDEIPYDVELLPGQHYNEYFPGGVLAMAAPLSDGIVSYPDGSPETVEQYAHDVTAFLAWAAEPHMENRKRMGLAVIIFLLIFAGLLWLAYRQVWSNVKH
ncbi:cytochrome c1 [Hyphobacterium sp. HN65]|uniref:Cytochrome c1 n=1 Tax=Hyphobacterium lacteum TaxID=3116575 RepID=A0ABU7LSZ2_9PROT|nr:cytochrome c1 [Hyphobacterium sp. HN65]MEE2526454.1 cytochrome c1 [Hyphobacterium sp. HN65]